jgi:hypothetical protein
MCVLSGKSSTFREFNELLIILAEMHMTDNSAADLPGDHSSRGRPAVEQLPLFQWPVLTEEFSAEPPATRFPAAGSSPS